VWRITAYDRDNREIARMEIAGGEITVGRDADRQMVLPSASVSRRHCKLVLNGPQPFVVDEGSANGVIVNGVRIAGPTAIVPGVRVDIAEFHLEFETPPETESVQPLGMRSGGDPYDVVRLVAEGGPFDGRIYEIPPRELAVGRAVDNDLVLDDPSLSRKHARLRRAGPGRIEIEDLGSSNGTFVNGRKVGKGAAGPRDTVRFGELTFRIEGSAAGGTRGNQPPGAAASWLLWGGIALAVMAIGAVAAVLLIHRGGGKDPISQSAELAETHIRTGKEKLAEKKFDAAAAEFEEALRLDPINKEARRYKMLAESEPQSQTAYKQATTKAKMGDRVGFDAALRFYAQIPPDSSFRQPAQADLSKRLVTFGEDQCKAKRWTDCAWAICKAYDVAPEGQRPQGDALAALREAERKLVKDRTYAPCKLKR
jgi:pSer/pThr/pTyr-binding forkhead associated (FHA) protein